MAHIHKTMIAVPVNKGTLEEADGAKRVYADFIISTDTPDRDGDIVEQDWVLDSFLTNPVALWAHKHDIPPVGEWQISTLKVVEKDGGKGKMTTMRVLFSRANPLGNQLGYQALEGTLRAVSVSFIPHEREEIRDEKGRITGYRYKRNELLEVSLVAVPAQGEAVITDQGQLSMKEVAMAVAKMLGIQEKSVVPYQDLPIDLDRDWDADAAKKRVAEWAGGPDKETIDWGKYRKAFVWYDAENPDNYGSYKLPIADVVEGKLTAIWRGVAAAMAALMGARGGVDIPEGDRRAVYNHLVKYYQKAEKEPPEFRETETIPVDIQALRIEIDTLKAQVASIQEKLGKIGGEKCRVAENETEEIMAALRRLVREGGK